MKKRLSSLLISFLLIVFSFNSSIGGTGGPDAFGYTWIDSAEPMGPSFNWIDLTNTPGAVQVAGLTDDNSVGVIPIGFDFTFYWSDYNSIKIGSNGWLSFDNVSNIAHCFPSIPTPGGSGNNFLAPFMSDLIMVGNGNPAQVWTYTNNLDQFIISYIDVPYWANTAQGYSNVTNSFQVILSGTDNSITFQYLNSNSNPADGLGCPTDLVIGIENLTGNIGLEHSVETLPSDNSVIRFIYPDPILISIDDVSPIWNMNDQNMVQIIDVSVPLTLSTAVANVGNTNMSNINVDGEILRVSDLNSEYSSNSNISSLNQGLTSIVEFPSTFTPSSTGSYDFRTTTMNASDINPSNNQNSSELLVIDCSDDVVLDYSAGESSTGTWAWQNSIIDQTGIGIFYDLPREPFTLDSVEVYISIPSTPGDVRVRIIADDNPTIGNGTVLGTVDIIGGNIQNNSFNTFNFNGLEIGSDGFFVFFTTGDSNISIGTNSVSPFSMANYEILGGTWSRFRNNDNTEFMVRVHGVCPEPIPIPTIGQWGMIVLSFLFLIIGTVTLGRFKRSRVEIS